MDFEYRVVKDYVHPDFGFVLNEDDIVTDAFFPEPDIPGQLMGKGVLEIADQDAEAARLADSAPVDDE